MPTRRAVYLSTFLLELCTSACAFDHDRVAPGEYGPEPAGSAAQQSAKIASTDAARMRASSAAPQAGSPADAGAGTSGHASAPTLPTPADRPSNGASGAGAVTKPPATSASSTPSSCDMSGRWLSTAHYVTDALGQLQYSYSYMYYEIEQKADVFTITRGLQCGTAAVGAGAFAASVDFRSSWASALAKVSFRGRKGTSTQAAGGCKVELEKWYTVLGATLPHYLDPTVPLPTANDRATGATPGWEDWDGDGQPGITGVISGVVSGRVFAAPRAWTALSGTVPALGSRFQLPMQWDQEANVMAVEGSPLLAAEVARAADPKLHFSEFARLQPDQATGDDAAICQSIVALAPSLTPTAAGM